MREVWCVVRCGNGITYYNGWSSLALFFSCFPWSLLPWFGLTQKCQKQFVNFPIKGDYYIVNLEYLQSSAFVANSHLSLICKKPAHFLSAHMALVSTFFQMFILGMYNFALGMNHLHQFRKQILLIDYIASMLGAFSVFTTVVKQ